MTVIEAYEDAVATVRVWQGVGVTASEVAGELHCRRDRWQAVIEAIVIILLAVP